MQFSRCPLLRYTVRVLLLVVRIHWTEHPSLTEPTNLSANAVCMWLTLIFSVAMTYSIKIVYIYSQIIYSHWFCNFSDNFLYYQVIYVYFAKKPSRKLFWKWFQIIWKDSQLSSFYATSKNYGHPILVNNLPSKFL